jgi:hypothetical protein
VLFEPDARFEGLPATGFGVFAIADRDERRHAILTTIHPALERLGQDLLASLGPHCTTALHPHLPRLDWPRDYQPFCTWLVLSHAAQGYQAGAQLNVGVHADHVSYRLGWDTAADAFGRFEFLCRHGGLGPELVEAGARGGLALRVYAAAAWPRGSSLVFESATDVAGSFDEVRRRGVWWELGRRLELPAELPRVSSPALGVEIAEAFRALLPLFERIAGG